MGEGDVALIFSRNSIWYPVAMLAALRIGAIGCGVSPDYSEDELAYAVKASRAKFIIATTENLDRATKAAKKVGISDANILLLEDSPNKNDNIINRATVQGLIAKAKSYGDASQIPAFKIPKGKTNADVCAHLAFSSGTTGLPKGVMISHGNVMAQCLQIQQVRPEGLDKMLAVLPYYHITGVVHQLHMPLSINANVYVLPAFTLDSMLQTVSRYRIEDILLVPPIIIRMVREPETLAKYDLSHVKRFASGAAPLSAEILHLLEKQFPGTGFRQGYGMTESSACITAHPPDKFAYKYAARVGTVVASTEVRIVDPDTGKDLGVGQAGEIWARGPQVAMGYLDNPKATADTFDKDGFLHTGDIGMFDEEGFLAITDRLKEMVKVKGIGVAPAELENLLLGHEAVEDCAVVGIQDERAGERPKAFVVLAGRPHKSNAEEVAWALLDFIRANKTKYKWVAEIEVIEAIPKSAAGKILRKKLRQLEGQSSSNVRVREDALRSKL